MASIKRLGAAKVLPMLQALIEVEPPPNQYGFQLLRGLAVRDASWLLKLATARATEDSLPMSLKDCWRQRLKNYRTPLTQRRLDDAAAKYRPRG
ncbi:MAG: hypothetical protein R3C05_23455 [Pirellulaceae bacterium]